MEQNCNKLKILNENMIPNGNTIPSGKAIPNEICHSWYPFLNVDACCLFYSGQIKVADARHRLCQDIFTLEWKILLCAENPQ